MNLILFLSFVTLIVGTCGQYGQPIVGGDDRFAFECRQTETDVIAFPNNREFEVTAGKSFAYTCDFFVDTRICEHYPQASGCEGVEIVWSMPEKLTQEEKKKGIKRKAEDMTIQKENGYTIYKTTLRLNDVGVTHNGQYSWQFNFRFEMRTVFTYSFKVTAIDMLQVNEPCKYDDSCQSNMCLQGLCVHQPDKAIPWIVVGTLLAIVAVILAVIGSVIYFINRKHHLYINRRF